ncbi:MAG: right-handed parallel beta-helix repeat-containing protein [Paludibacter sp.]
MKRIKLLFCLLTFAVFANALPTVYYVSASATGDGTGTSWTNAFLSPAAAIASTTPQAGDEIWVKRGTYISATTLSWETGQNFYGGFVGTETLRSERSTDASLTILEGTNTNKVLNAPSMASATTWDGFTIQKGLSTGGGGGAFLQKNAILSNCIFQNNKTTSFGGGAIFIQGTTGDADSIKVINCVIKNNTITYAGAAKRGGGGIYVKAGSYKAVIRGCSIESNTADGLANSSSDIDGGGVYLCDGILENSTVKNNIVTNKNATSPFAVSYTGKCQGGGVFIMPQTTTNPITVRNCIITGNISETSIGGGISIDPLWGATTLIAAPVNITKTIISNNWAYKNGGGIMTDGLNPSSTASYTFANCVIANNESSTVAAGGGGAFVNNVAAYLGSVSFANCTVTNNKMVLGTYGGAGIYYNFIKADISNCAFWGNGGVTTFYNVKVNTTLTTNKMTNCAFDNRFVESEVSPTDFATDLTGKVIVDVANTGSTGGTLYPNFTSPTNFVGKTVTAEDITSLTAANWSINSASALFNAGATLASYAYDITGLARPQGTKYDIGAYEVPYYNTTVTFNEFGTVDSYTTGAVVSDVKGKQLTFTITPNSLYKITSVLYNNVEVKGDMVGTVYTAPALSANATLVVQFDLATGLDKTTVDFSCISANNGLEISGLTVGEEVTIFSIAGVRIANKTAHSSNVSLLLPQGIYLVKVANSVRKVIVK